MMPDKVIAYPLILLGCHQFDENQNLILIQSLMLLFGPQNTRLSVFINVLKKKLCHQFYQYLCFFLCFFFFTPNGNSDNLEMDQFFFSERPYRSTKWK